MALTGKIEDVSLADLLQFINGCRRTGTLRLARGAERAQLGFVRGRLVTVAAGGLAAPDRSLSAESLGSVVLREMSRALRGLLAWERGEFHFLPDRVPDVDELPLDLRGLRPGLELNEQRLLLETA